MELEETLEREQEFQVNKLMRKIEKLETDILSKQNNLEQVICLCITHLIGIHDNDRHSVFQVSFFKNRLFFWNSMN